MLDTEIIGSCKLGAVMVDLYSEHFKSRDLTLDIEILEI
jgi:hypothetical protein